MELTNNDKQLIANRLRLYVAKFASQNKAVASMKGTSAGTVSNILNGKWDNISEDMWRKVSDQVGLVNGSEKDWQVVETHAFHEITIALKDAQTFKNVTWVVGEAGCGKTTTARIFGEENREVYYILCSEDLHKGDFVREIAHNMGIRTDGFTVRELWITIQNELIKMDAPLLVFDEADKLIESVFQYFISLYNKIEDKCGVVFLSTDYIKTRIDRGLRCKKRGYKEFYSRIGRKYFELDDTTPHDVYAICVANGLTDEKDINEVIAESNSCEYDLRRVKKSIHRIKRIKAIRK
ncbi:AAA family ATPase [Prevotella sp.]|uniref:AAA family ATPase n=1 Tax=Prevotella sp. TaxID=59823 RepID=UPI0026007029|nr:AAA family ATPase [Prevotella sp.]